MANYGRSFGVGLVVGAAAGALLGAAEYYGRRSAPRLIDWGWAVGVASRTCGAVPPLTAAERAALEARYRAVLERIEAPIAAYTNTRLPLQGTAVRVLDRPAWIRTNAGNFQELLQPFEDFYQERARKEPSTSVAASGVGRLALSSQLGVLLGYLARRVLGQYDISLLGREPVEAGKLYFVEPNIRALETTLGLPGEEFRTWLALHEATHAHEFELHPWVRPYLNSTLQEYLRSMVEDLAEGQSGHATGLAARMVENLRAGRNLIQSFMTPEQRELVSRLQALMALLEGYSNHIMHQVGRGLLPHFAEIEARIEARQKQRSAIELWFLRVTGLSMKLEQYALGEAFVQHVVQARGVEFLNRVWEGPEQLPSEAELRAPAAWVTRVEAVAA
jgi:coenzyme F420 biosynthesis associated uncharacterized protein